MIYQFRLHQLQPLPEQLHSSKAPAPIDVTLSGIVIESQSHKNPPHSTRPMQYHFPLQFLRFRKHHWNGQFQYFPLFLPATKAPSG